MVLGTLEAVAVSATDTVVLTGGDIPRLAPFTARAVNCGNTSCLDITWRVRGAIGPRLRWQLSVLRPDGVAAYRGSRLSTRGRRVTGLLHPTRPPQCGPYRITLSVEDRDGDRFEETRIVVRRHRCLT